MKKFFKKLLCIVLSITCIAPSLQANAEAEKYLYQKWCPQLFEAPSTKFDYDLAAVTAEMSDKAEDNPKKKKEDPIKKLYQSYGIEKAVYKNFNKSAAFAIGQDTLKVDGVQTTIIVITARGSKTMAEFAGDLMKGRKKKFLGTKVWDNVFDFEEEIWKGLKSYIKKHPDIKKKKNLKILVTGHSLGGAAANLVGARLTHGVGGKEWWSHIKKKDIYVYTFGAIKTLAEEQNISKGYGNIHNIYNYYDSYGPNGNQSSLGASSPYAKFGHTELYFHRERETGNSVISSCNSHLMSSYKKAIENPKQNGMLACPAAEKLFDVDFSQAVREGRYIYYIGGADCQGQTIMRYDVVKKKQKKIADACLDGNGPGGFVSICVSGNYIYAVWEFGESVVWKSYIYRFSKDGRDKKKLALGCDPIIIKDYIYYRQIRMGYEECGETGILTGKLCRMKKNGASKRVVGKIDSTCKGFYKYGNRLLIETPTSFEDNMFYDINGNTHYMEQWLLHEKNPSGLGVTRNEYKEVVSGGYKYYTDISRSGKHRVRRKNIKTGKISTVASYSNMIQRIDVCKDYLLVTVYNANRVTLQCISVKGKKKKTLGSWGLAG